MKQISTDVLALACIAGCAAVGIGATAAFQSGPESPTSTLQTQRADCFTGLQEPVSSISISPSGVVAVTTADLRLSELTLCASVEDHRKKRRRRRHPHTHRTQERVRVHVTEARERVELVRAQAMERRLEAEMRAMESAVEALDSELDREIEANVADQMRRLEARLRAAERGGR